MADEEPEARRKRLAKRRAYERERYANDSEARATQLAHNYAWSKANRAKANELQRAYTRRIKRLVFDHYGGACACCGETELAFLAIDHINGGGNKARQGASHRGNGMYVWLRRNNYPEGFQVLCHNCNHGKYINGGVCPHQM